VEIFYQIVSGCIGISTTLCAVGSVDDIYILFYNTIIRYRDIREQKCNTEQQFDASERKDIFQTDTVDQNYFLTSMHAAVYVTVHPFLERK
jgi:hypothetical protein